MDRKWWTLIAVCTGVFMLLLDVTIVNVALPQIETAFKANLSDLQWVIDAYALTLAALLLTAGSIADLAGRRRVFAIGIVVFTLGSVLCGVGAELAVPVTRARAAGRRRRDHVRDRAGAAGPGVPAAGARRGLCRVRRGDRRGGGRRAGARRGASPAA